MNANEGESKMQQNSEVVTNVEEIESKLNDSIALSSFYLRVVTNPKLEKNAAAKAEAYGDVEDVVSTLAAFSSTDSSGTLSAPILELLGRTSKDADIHVDDLLDKHPIENELDDGSASGSNYAWPQTYLSGDATECEKERTEEVVKEKIKVLAMELPSKMGRELLSVLERYEDEASSDESSLASEYEDNSQYQHWQNNVANEDHYSPPPNDYELASSDTEMSSEAESSYERSRRKRDDDDQSVRNQRNLKRRKLFHSPSDSLDPEFKKGSDATSTSEVDEVASESEKLPSRLERSEQVPSHPNNAVFPFDGASRKLMETVNAQMNSMAKQFNTYSNYAQLGKHPPIPINASLVTICQSKVAAEFVYGGQLLATNQILEDFRRALEGIHIFRNEYIAVMEKQVDVLKSVPSFLSSQSQSLGELLSYLSRSEKIDDSLAFNELENECASFRAIKAFEGKLSRTKLKEYLIVSQVVRNLLSLLANISVTAGVLAEIIMGEICTLSDELGELAARLYKEIYEEKRKFHLNLTALELIQSRCTLSKDRR